MSKPVFYFLVLFACFTALEAKSVKPTEYKQPEWVSDGVWETLKPSLLPYDHPVRAKLDKIFKEHRVTRNKASFMAAGFRFHDRWNRRRVIALHKDLKGFVVKTYLDTHKTSQEDGMIWQNRINGAKQVQDTIDRHGFNDLMKVPKKWLYPIPKTEEPAGHYPKGYVLIVEDMDILNNAENYKKYKTEVNQEQLYAIFTVIQENRMFDCTCLFNIPFSKTDGKIAFIDTEGFNSPHIINYPKMTPRFPSKLQNYWHNLTRGKY